MIGSIPIRWVPFLVAGCWLLVMMAMLVAGTYSGCVRLVRSSSGYLSGVACFRLVVELVALAWLLSVSSGASRWRPLEALYSRVYSITL